MTIKDASELRAIYGFPSGRAKDKVLTSLDKHAVHFIHTSPFLILSTTDSSGNLDASPRGGEPGFVAIANSNEILIPDFKGNNRIDSLVNIVESGKVGMIFLIPGIDTTLRINGSAIITTSVKALNHFSDSDKQPISCISVKVDEVFLHCAKAFMRSKLWNADSMTNSEDFPTMGLMLKDQLGTEGDPETRAAMLERYKKDL
ncbi:MAG: PPOX class probable FMN-dependent enzyme [Crocinitomicaceae bacterium]|jgi:PPOX class probable FMN-dependent enzyme